MPTDEPTNQPETLSGRFMRGLQKHLRESPVRENPFALQPDEDAEQPEIDDSTDPSAPSPESAPTHSPAGRTGWLTALISAAALVGGLLLHNHYEPLKQLCNSGVGALGQAVSTSAQTDCSLDSFLADMGLWVAIISGLILAGAVLTLIAKRQQREAGTGGW